MKRPTARDRILAAVRANKPSPVSLPDLPTRSDASGDQVAAFTVMIESIGGRVMDAGADLAAAVRTAYPEATRIVAATPEVLPDAETLTATDDTQRLADIEVLVCRGHFGVAENGAVWLDEQQMGHRAAPFLTQHMVLVLNRTALVSTMHDAYARIAEDIHGGEQGFGLFMAGPSKTADIEQSLVIGAHGPRSLTVLLV